MSLVFSHFRNGQKQYIDVWPVNLLNPGKNDAFDTTSLFMMQLACIVNMVPQWSKSTLRVCVCDEITPSSFSVDWNLLSHSDKLRNLLKMLRISAELYCVSEWDQVLESQSNDTESYLRRYLFIILKKRYFLINCDSFAGLINF